MTKKKTVWIKTGNHGLRYREHDTKTTGAGRSKRPLRYYSAVFKLDGKAITDAYGWEDSFTGGHHEIESIALKLKMNRKAKTPPFTYKEMIADRKDKLHKEEQAKQAELRRQEITERTRFSRMFGEYCEANSGKTSLKDEKSYFKNWIMPAIGDKRLQDIRLLDLERIRRKMEKAGKAPRSIGYIKSIVRQVFNYAVAHELFSGSLPTVNFLKNQKLNNRRERYLTPEEAGALLTEIRKHSLQTYQITLLSMNTGMRFGEIATLRWQHINTEQNYILILNPKNGESRIAHMNAFTREMLDSMTQGEPDSLVFPSQKGKQMTSISKTFSRAVDSLGLNDDIMDRRMKVVFHTMRHSCASWLANSGVEMQVIAKILGHRSLAMTNRYSHINDSSVKGAMKTLEQTQTKEAKVSPIQTTG